MYRYLLLKVAVREDFFFVCVYRIQVTIQVCNVLGVEDTRFFYLNAAMYDPHNKSPECAVHHATCLCIYAFTSMGCVWYNI